MSIKEHWAEAKSTTLWILIIVLSLRVYGTWLDDKAQKKARLRWNQKGSQILLDMSYYACVEAAKPLNEVLRNIENYLNGTQQLENDSDFYDLTREEKANFRDLIKVFATDSYESCRKPARRMARLQSEDLRSRKTSLTTLSETSPSPLN